MLKDMMAPRCKKDLRRMLGMATYLMSFVPDFSRMLEPISKLLKGEETEIRWETEQAEAWQRLVKTLEEKMILYHPSSNSDLVLRKDASTIGVGGMVAMIQDGVEKPLAFFSKKFTEVQQKWCTLDQEAFGLFWVMSKAKNFLWGRRFIAETDHRNLSFMLKSESAKVQRWRMAVMEFDFVIHHIKGKDNTVADTLSRCYVKSLSTKSLVEIAKTAQEALTDEEKSHLKEKDGFWVDKLDRVV
ncbi:hypothetical protein ADUPG1_002115, partial [Aduncisulcus paluster]